MFIYHYFTKQLRDRDLALNQRVIDKQRVKQKYTHKIQHETDKMKSELEMKLKAQRDHLQVFKFINYLM